MLKRILLRFLSWLPLALFVCWIISELLTPAKQQLAVKCAISSVSLLLFLVFLMYLVIRRPREQPFPSFVAGLVDMANFGREAPAIVLLTGFLLLNHFVNLIPEKDILALLTSFFILLLTLEVVWIYDLLTPPARPPSELVPTSGLVLFMGRLREEDKLRLCDINKCPDNFQIWQEAIKCAGELYQKVAEEELRSKGSFTLLDVSKKVRERLLEKANGRLDNDEKKIWEQVASLAVTPILAALRAVDYHSCKLEHVWAIVSEEAKDSFQIFEVVLKKAFPKVKCHQIPLKDVNDPVAIKKAVNIAYEDAVRLGLSEDQVTTDITGGSAIMSVGGALACVRSKRRLQYLRQDNFQFIAIPVTIASLKEAIDELLEQLPMVTRRGF